MAIILARSNYELFFYPDGVAVAELLTALGPSQVSPSF